MSLNDIDYLAALETEKRAGNSIVPEVRRLIFSNSGDIEEALAYESSVGAHIAVAGVVSRDNPRSHLTQSPTIWIIPRKSHSN